MTTYRHNGQWAHGLGQKLGHAWRGFMRAERHAARWLEAHSVPAGVARAVPWLVNATLVAMLLYVAFWLGVVLLLLVGASWGASTADARISDDNEEPQWRNGWDGYGLYSHGLRIDGGNADDD